MGRSIGLLTVMILGLSGVIAFTLQGGGGFAGPVIIAAQPVEPAAGPATADRSEGSLCVTRDQICRIAPAPEGFPCSCYDVYHGNVPGRARLLSADPGPLGGAGRIWTDEQSLFGEDFFE